MKAKCDIIVKSVMAAAAAVAIYLFFRFKYTYHLHYQELYQMFLFTSDYFMSVIAVPGGLADWLSRFFTQFFYYAWCGAAVIAALFIGVQLLTFACCSRRSLLEYALSFIPAGCLAVYMCDENALVCAFIAIIIGLACSFAVLPVKKKSTGLVVCIVMTAALYMLCGNLATVAFAAAAAVRKKDWRFAAAGIATAAACTFAAIYLFNYPAIRLAFGIHYHRYHNVIPFWAWASVVSAAGVIVFSLFHSKERKHSVQLAAAIAAYCLVAAATCIGISVCNDQFKEEVMEYSFLARMQMWNKIISIAVKKNPMNPTTVSCLNLALAETGDMGEHMFEFFQKDVDGLIPPYKREHITPIPAAESYWQLGFMNTAQRFCFEAQEGIPDYQKSSWCHKRMAETHLVNGDYHAARKYLEPLKYTVFYRKWALETEKLLNNPELIDKDPLYGNKRSVKLKKQDFFFSDYEMDSMLGLHFLEDSDNKLAFQFLLGWCLLKKDLQRFIECYQIYITNYDAKSYQEAIILYWALTHDGPEGMPPISKRISDRFGKFLNDYKTKSLDQIERLYSDTYWFYYYFRN